MLIELDVFSGRPNPRWELDAFDSQMLMQLQSRLEVSSRVPVAPPGLGYRGFWYADEAGKVHAYRGFVKTPDALLADPSFSIEQYLLDRLPEEFVNIRGRIALEIASWK